MNLFDILGPVMVGPSSSHTAGAVRIGRMARRLLGEGTPVMARITLCGSFAATGQGHGTDRALVAGLLGMQPDDGRIPDSFTVAKEKGMGYSFSRANLSGEHPNTAKIELDGKKGGKLSMIASSLGGGRIRINAIDGLEASFSGDYPTLIIRNEDKPGIVSEVTYALSRHNANIATMQLYRDRRGGLAVMVIECDAPLSPKVREKLALVEGIVRYTYLDLGGK